MKLVCLANSFKEGGRCLAGIQLDDFNQPLFNGNRPVWIRPTSGAEHGQVASHLCNNVSVLDIIEIDDAITSGEGYQSENTTFREGSIRVVGQLNQASLNQLCDNNNLSRIFGNRGKAVPEERIQNINHSLMLISVSDFEVISKEYEDRVHPQIRLTFRYNGNLYDLPITDPIFLNHYARDSSIIDDKEEIFISLSLAVPYNDWYYKLVASIIY